MEWNTVGALLQGGSEEAPVCGLSEAWLLQLGTWSSVTDQNSEVAGGHSLLMLKNETQEPPVSGMSVRQAKLGVWNRCEPDSVAQQQVALLPPTPAASCLCCLLPCF